MPASAINAQKAARYVLAVTDNNESLTVDGTLAVSNFPGTFAVSNFPATQAVTGTFWPVTQPVSGTVAVSNLPATQPVSGTFWQTTQPISGSVSVSNLPATQPISAASLPLPTGAATDRATAVAPYASRLTDGTAFYKATTPADTQPVSGTFWPATQPVSGTVAVSNFPASQVVTGTFWQATQPVSGTVAVSNFPATQPVSGTFWQATQPVSGTFWQATQPVSGTVAVSSVSGTVSTNNKAAYTGVTSASSARTVSGTASLGTMPTGTGKVIVNINLTAFSGTVPTILFKLTQMDANGVSQIIATQTVAATPVVGTYFFIVGPSQAWVNGAAPTASVPSVSASPLLLSDTGAVTLSWTIAGTTPSITFQYAAQFIAQ